ncbi:MAG: phage Gp37/Gp68 family protein [Alistipes sp.]|nr:phage Gp37/Gp68 family protein [Bacteroidales bacterium]MBR5492498.1 phage Gp37/Gp68 family protein [Alistipes sp.]MBR5920051.1 phage Gp37/Gp68 family protein [Bacteroidales bacterium]
MNKTKIPWTERTWNPVTGCSKYSAGCAHCYAEVMAKRLQGMGQKRYANGFELTLHPEALNEPKKVKEPSMFFVCSMADLFHDNVPFEFIDKVMQVIRECPQHTFQILTKRAERMFRYYQDGEVSIPSNCWLGVTVESIFTRSRIEWLRDIDNISVRFLSCEPLIEDLGVLKLENIDWVIVGGESGPKARPMKKEWLLNIKRQCEEQGVPFFFKQWGTYGEDGVKRDKKSNGCTIDGQEYQAWPKAWKGGVQ